jgi:hypothetical protein
MTNACKQHQFNGNEYDYELIKRRRGRMCIDLYRKFGRFGEESHCNCIGLYSEYVSKKAYFCIFRYIKLVEEKDIRLILIYL